MKWRKGRCKGKDVWLEVDAGGAPIVQRGLTRVRYSRNAGARVYSASVRNVEATGDAIITLADGSAAPPPGQRQPGRGQSGRGSSGFGKAGTRTAAQAQAARQAATQLLAGFRSDAAICFTDGACRGNPGPAGAGVVVRLPDGRRLERHRALGQGTNNIGELTAIAMALEILTEEKFPVDRSVEILTDSKYSYNMLILGWKAKANQELIRRTRQALRARKANIHWIAGHVGIPENERADELANRGVTESARR